MKQSIIYLALCFLIIACKDTKKENTEDSSNSQETTYEDTSEIGRMNYAAIWRWTTDDNQLITDNIVKISDELTKLWKEGHVENVYYNSEAKEERMENFPNISFFVKAHDEEKARAILNDLTIVKKKIATYHLYPVGNLWLDRKFKTIHEKGMTKSYAAVWKTTGKPSDELTKAQSDKVLELHNKGDIENVYFDIEGTQQANDITDFVFYVNANSEEEAHAVCNSLPFSKENLATYKLHEVGVFWMGKYEKK